MLNDLRVEIPGVVVLVAMHEAVENGHMASRHVYLHRRVVADCYGRTLRHLLDELQAVVHSVSTCTLNQFENTLRDRRANHEWRGVMAALCCGERAGGNRQLSVSYIPLQIIFKNSRAATP